MKAIILSAGQGKRLLPLTEKSPKCLVPVGGRALLDWQLDQLAGCGIDHAVVVTGFAGERVDALLSARADRGRVETLYNPFFSLADNLVSCWVARSAMDSDFVLINGDTLFEAAVLERLLSSPEHPVTLACDRKARYDDDDMKVRLRGDRLLAVGKDLPPEHTDGESIGVMVFRRNGPALFRDALEQAVRRPEGLRQWYLSVVSQLARAGHVRSQSIHGLAWAEVDYPLDLARADRMVAGWATGALDAAPRAG